MNNPLEALPLNTKRCYVAGVAHGGAQIYIPVDSRDDGVLAHKRDELQAWLDAQPQPPKLAA